MYFQLVKSLYFNMPEAWKGKNNKNELYLHDHTGTYSIAKAILRIQITSYGNYVTLVIICHEHQSKLKHIWWIGIDKVIRGVHQHTDQNVNGWLGKGYPFRAEAPSLGHHREYPPGPFGQPLRHDVRYVWMTCSSSVPTYCSWYNG